MSDEITLKDVWNHMETMRTEFNENIAKLEGKVDDNIKAFHTFEAGRVTQLIQDVAILKTKDENTNKKLEVNDTDSEKRKDWMWGAFEKIVFAVVGAFLFLLGLLLQHAGILNIR